MIGLSSDGYHRAVLYNALRFLLIPLAVLATSRYTPARAGTSIDGLWETPYGRVKLEKAGDSYVGTLVEPARVCGYPKGAAVVRGRLEEGLFTAEVLACYSQGCHDDEWRLALALTQGPGPDRLMGSLAMPAHGCATPVAVSRAFSFSRAKQPIEAVPPPALCLPRLPMKPEARLLFEGGCDLAMKGELERAVKKLKLAHDLDLGNADILNQIGSAFSARHDWLAARSYFQRALRAQPTFVPAHYNLARAFSKGGKAREGLRALRAAVDNGYDDPLAMDSDSDLAPVRELSGYGEVRRAAERNRVRAAR